MSYLDLLYGSNCMCQQSGVIKCSRHLQEDLLDSIQITSFTDDFQKWNHVIDGECEDITNMQSLNCSVCQKSITPKHNGIPVEIDKSVEENNHLVCDVCMVDVMLNKRALEKLEGEL